MLTSCPLCPDGPGGPVFPRWPCLQRRKMLLQCVQKQVQRAFIANFIGHFLLIVNVCFCSLTRRPLSPVLPGTPFGPGYPYHVTEKGTSEHAQNIHASYLVWLFSYRYSIFSSTSRHSLTTTRTLKKWDQAKSRTNNNHEICHEIKNNNWTLILTRCQSLTISPGFPSSPGLPALPNSP